MRIKLSNGAELKQLTLNGTVFSAPYPLSADVFEYSLSEVQVFTNDDSTDPDDVIREAVLVFLNSTEESCEFALRARTPSERNLLTVRADIDYIAMLTGIRLED